jgi:hypothetical protein
MSVGAGDSGDDDDDDDDVIHGENSSDCGSISSAPSELALGSSPCQAAGTMDSYLLAVSGVDPHLWMGRPK